MLSRYTRVIMYPTLGVRIRVMGMLAGGRVTVHGVACIIVRAQHFKANFSITVTLISAAATLCFDYLKKKDNMQYMQGQGGEMLT